MTTDNKTLADECNCPNGRAEHMPTCASLRATLADVQPGGRVRLGDQAERARFKAWWDAARPLEGSAFPYEIAWAAWQAALSAQPSPGGQGDARRQWLEVRGLAAGIVKNLQAFADSPHKGAWCGALDDALSFADQIEKDAAAAYESILAARQPVEFERAIPTRRRESAVELLLSLGFVWNNQRWEDRRQPVGEPVSEAIEQLADDVESCVSDACGYLASDSGWDDYGIYRDDAAARYRALPDRIRGLAAPPAQAVDLGPASIPDTPEVRDILGRPNFWCSPWANVLRMRGDAIPRKAEEEQAAVIRFMLNHYLAHGADWAETAGAELDAIRKADSQAVGK